MLAIMFWMSSLPMLTDFLMTSVPNKSNPTQNAEPPIKNQEEDDDDD
jgi:hypothetical protein